MWPAERRRAGCSTPVRRCGKDAGANTMILQALWMQLRHADYSEVERGYAASASFGVKHNSPLFDS
jgi:hypothetical protein